jgi:sugar (pentulose or hexulose) kinase
MGRRVFLKSEAGINELQEEIDFSIFKSFSHGYHQLMTELCDLTKEAIDLVIPSKDESENIYIIGGFAKNVLFLNILASAFPEKRILSAEIDNASALGAALVIRNSLNMEKAFTCKLGLKSWKL